MLGEIYRVTMIGHRIVEDFDIEEKLYDLFKNMLRTKKYVEFYLGRNGDFDILAASVIKRLQKNYRNDNSASFGIYFRNNCLYTGPQPYQQLFYRGKVIH